MKIRELSISARVKLCLHTAGYEDIEDLVNVTEKELLKIRNLNEKGVEEIRVVIDECLEGEEKHKDGVDDEMVLEDGANKLMKKFWKTRFIKIC